MEEADLYRNCEVNLLFLFEKYVNHGDIRVF